MKMLKNKTRFFLKLYIVIWVVLILLVLAKLLFGYYQPYVIPNDKMQMLSDFIDRNKWLVIILDSIFYIFNGLIMVLCAIKQWWFKKTWQTWLVIGLLLTKTILNHFAFRSNILTLFLSLGLPLILDYRKWLYTIIAFVLNIIFLKLSLWFNGNTNLDELPQIIQMMFVFDYYVMLLLEYITTNLIKFKKKELKKDGIKIIS